MSKSFHNPSDLPVAGRLPLPLYVCGSLCWGESAHHLLTTAVFRGRGRVKGVGYKLSGVQGVGLAVRGGGDSWVPGELYTCDAKLLHSLEAALGGEFSRKIIAVHVGSDGPTIEAIVHVWTGAFADVPTWPGAILADDRPFPGPTAWYFGYASNMFHMAERRKLNVVEPHRIGRADGWQIAFAKDSGNGQHNYATLLPKRGGRVKGALYRMKQAELEAQLDPQEKEGWHLVRRTFAVEIEGTGPGVGEIVWAEAYICLPRWWFWNRISHPTNTEKIVPGARLVGLDDEYVAWLEAFCNTPSNPEDYDLDLDTRV